MKIVLCIIVNSLFSVTAWAQGPTTDLPFAGLRLTASWEQDVFDLRIGQQTDETFKVNMALFALEIGVIPQRLSVFGAVAVGRAEVDGWGIDGNLDTGWRAGVRATVWRHGDWAIGLSGDVGRWQAEDSIFLADRPFTTRATVTEYRIRPGVSWTSGSATIYAGPCIGWVDGDMVVRYGLTPIRLEVQNGPEYGGFAGAMVHVTRQILLAGEVQLGSGGQAGSLGVGLEF